jgi:P22 coat protein - gene protein 5
MAVANTYSALLPTLFGQVVTIVRQQSVMPRLVLNLSDSISGSPGSTIQMPDQVTGVTRAVVHDIQPVDPTNLALTATPLTLSNWREAPFTIDDKMAAEVVAGTIPRVLQSYAAALADYVDTQIMALYTSVYNTGASDAFGGGATALPAAFTVDATKNPSGLRAVAEAGTLIDQLGTPKGDRRVVLSAYDTWAAQILGQFLKFNERGDQGGIIDGEIGRKIGMDWWMDQATPTHTAGTVGTTAGQTLTCPTANVGDTAITFVGTITTALTLKAGDVFIFSNSNQTYVNNTLVTSTTNSLAVTSFSPPLKVAVTSANSAKVLPSHKVNLLFHRDAIAFASRPLGGIGNPDNVAQAFDEVSGLNLRVEIMRQNKQDYVSIDCLFGAAVRDAKMIARVASQL